MQNILIIGAGGHAKVVIDCLLSTGRYLIVGATDPREDLWGLEISERIQVLGDDSILDNPEYRGCAAAIGIGVSETLLKRRRVYERLVSKGYDLPPITHGFAWVSRTVQLMPGSQVMPGAVIQSDTCIGENAIINTSASVDHDCSIGPHAHIAPGVVLGGGVTIGEAAFIGMGAKILPGIAIGRGAVVGAGAVVIKKVPESTVVIGIPAERKPHSTRG